MKVLGKYLFEVIVIFIGITLSFLFEEWRENRKEDAQELGLYRSLLKDIESDIKRVNRIVDATKYALTNIDSTLIMTQRELPPEKQSFLRNAMSFYGAKEKNQSFLVTFESAKSSGDLKLIRNQEVLRSIYLIQDNQNILMQMLEVERNNASRLYEHIIQQYPGMITKHTHYLQGIDPDISNDLIRRFITDKTLSDRIIGLRWNSQAVSDKASEISKNLDELKIKLQDVLEQQQNNP